MSLCPILAGSSFFRREKKRAPIRAMEFFDIEAILAEEEPVSARFRTDSYGIGYLQHFGDRDMTRADVGPPAFVVPAQIYRPGYMADGPREKSSQLKKGDRLDLPLWLAGALQRHAFVEVEPRSAFSIAFRKKLAAGAGVVNLFAKCPHFYSVGKRLAAM